MRTYTTALAVLVISATTFARATPRGTGPLFDPNYRGETNTTIPNELSASTCVFISTDPNWGGDKSWGCALANVCSNLVPAYLNQVSAVGPDRGAGECTLFQGDNCSSAASQGIWYPGISDLSTIGWDNRVRSMVCTGF